MPTIGYNTIGATSGTATTAFTPQGFLTASGFTYTAVSGDVVTAVWAYGSGTGTPAVGIYTVSGGNPSTMVGSPVSISVGSTLGWYTTSCSIALTAGVEYTVCFDYSTDEDWTWYRDIVASQCSNNTTTTGPLPATWTHSAVGGGRHSFYATVTSGGGGTPPIFFGTTAITDIKLGTTDIAKTYLGTTQIWP